MKHDKNIAVELIDIKKQFERNGRWVADGINLALPVGSSTCVLGPSGEGKSVLLKQMSGLIKPSSGIIKINGIDITKLQDVDLENIYKQCGYVFQFAALLDSLTIFENIGIALLEAGMPPEEVREIVKEKIKEVNLKEDVLEKYPAEISGGMKKRVGIARTLITNPTIIFYDEPTSGLDPITTHVVHELILHMQKKFGITSIIISHDVSTFKYVDNVAFLYKGKIAYFDKAETIWESDNPLVYQFIRGLTSGPIF